MERSTCGELSICRKQARSSGRAAFFCDGNGTVLVLSLLVALVASFLPTLLITWTLSYLIDWNMIYAETPALYSALYALESLSVFVFSIFTACPLYLGVYRFAVCIMTGRRPQILEIFYYFTEKSRYFRSLRVLFRLALRIAVPYFFFAMFFRLAITGEAAVAVLLILPLALLFSLLSALWLAATFGFVTHAVTDDDRSLRACLDAARTASRGRRGSHMLFVFSLAWRMLLSLIPVGVPLLIYMLPVALLSLPNYVWRCEAWGNGMENAYNTNRKE